MVIQVSPWLCLKIGYPSVSIIFSIFSLWKWPPSYLIPGLQEGHVVQTLARQSVSVLDFAEDDVIFCTGNMAVASYSIMQGAAGWQGDL